MRLPVALSEQRSRRAAPALARLGRLLLDSSWLYRLVVLVIVAVVWEAGARSANSLLIPTFLETVEAVGLLLVDPKFWQAVLVSNQALVIGFAISIGLGIPVGFLIGRFRLAARLAEPYINILVVTPMAAIIPLLVMSVGIGLAARIILVVLFAIPMVVVNAQAGVRAADTSLIEMSRSFGATERQIWKRVLLPGSLPAVMAGVRIGLGRGVTGMIIVELLMVSVGLGGLILEFKGFFEAELLYATVLLVVVEAVVLISLVQLAERRVTAWTGSGGAR